MDHTRDVIKSQMAELKDLMKEVAALDTQLNSAAPHKRIELCLEMLEKTSQVKTLKEDTQRKIDTMDVHPKKTLARQLHEITKMDWHGRAFVAKDNTDSSTRTH
ncbi:hypothetical protein PENSOL_c029G04541 [Penicillium solitum]|uniref:Uncharacterized protein n=1 Tax=Penicillium solitum TaxID=60172 RepID=A0A1V6QXX7_9EURO|nr:uncharacterized protein PENSOL_c029G04541 [Penicillium solitum]OQD93917.1 hypothetical protein PENSOL_c029G04541 [Penicillium solitum]